MEIIATDHPLLTSPTDEELSPFNLPKGGETSSQP